MMHGLKSLKKQRNESINLVKGHCDDELACPKPATKHTERGVRAGEDCFQVSDPENIGLEQ